ncbi:cell division protein FtsQ [Chitinophaga costaii]|uniref:Cell division protein FtsQ n=2 Tax=Chitinophaga costaii TaxID=1335309 RepID=A0A1C4BTY7_9BACT|nr:hypothetical protein [Chitinophaga costaii]SCC10223.1 cell division protein FtsQ [Chitinophaga costaii]
MGIAFLWMVAFAGFVVLVVAATKDKESSRCKSVAVQIVGSANNAFLNEKDIKNLVVGNKTTNPVGRLVSEVNLSALEKVVATNPWIKTADLYIDNSDVVNIRATLREPVARIFTTSGSTFYFDKDLGHIPVSARYTARVPVFTNFPTAATTLTHADSILAAQVVEVASYVLEDAFWMAQIEQVNITPDYQLEMTPTLGDQVIVFGEGTDVAIKFNKLLAFYRQGLNKVGWGNYTVINVAFDDEVVCTRKDGGIPVKAPALPVFDSTHADVAGDDGASDADADNSSNTHLSAMASAAAAPEKPKAPATKPVTAHHTPEKPKGTLKPKALYPGSKTHF